MTHSIACPCCPESDAKGDKCIQLMLSRGSRDLGKDGAEPMHNLASRSL